MWMKSARRSGYTGTNVPLPSLEDKYHKYLQGERYRCCGSQEDRVSASRHLPDQSAEPILSCSIALDDRGFATTCTELVEPWVRVPRLHLHHRVRVRCQNYDVESCSVW